MEKDTRQFLVNQFINGTRISNGLRSIKENFAIDKRPFGWVDETMHAFKEAMELEWGEKLKFIFFRMDFKYDPNARNIQSKMNKNNIVWRFVVAPSNNPSDQFVLFEINIYRQIVDLEHYTLSDEWELFIDCWNDVPVKILFKEESKYAVSLAVEIMKSINNVQFISILEKHAALNDFLVKKEN